MPLHIKQEERHTDRRENFDIANDKEWPCHEDR